MQSKSKKNEIKKIIKKSLKQKETFLPNKQKVIVFPKNKMQKAKEFFTLNWYKSVKIYSTHPVENLIEWHWEHTEKS